MTTNPVAALDELIQSQARKIEVLEESMAQRILDLDSIGWAKISDYTQEDEDGPTLDSLKLITPKLRELAATNPLHVRGAQLRHSYVFGRGVDFNEIKPGTQTAMDDPYNRRALFSAQAYETNNLALFTDGNFFVLKHVEKKQFTTVPMTQVTGVVTDPDDNSRIQYIQRSWNSNGEDRVVWYPLARFKRSNKIAKSISAGEGAPSVPVSQESVIYHHETKRQTGWVWGVPDSLAAMVWTMAYSGYLSDNTQLVKALSKFAWTMTKTSASGVDRTAAQVREPGGVGGTGVMAQGNALASVGVPSAQVNMNNGQPLAAMVATSFGVPVIALLSSPGATGGSYGAATTLDTPTLKGMRAVQDSWAVFYEEILRDLGSPKAVAAFPNIDTDPEYRQIASIASAYGQRLLHQDEARDATMDLLDVPKLHENPPEPLADPNDAVSGQGKQGAAKGGTNQGDTDNNDATSDATPTK